MTKEGELLYVTAAGQEVYSTERDPDNTPEAITERRKREGLDSIGNKRYVEDASFSKPFVKPNSDVKKPPVEVRKPTKNNVLDLPTSDGDGNNKTMSQAA